MEQFAMHVASAIANTVQVLVFTVLLGLILFTSAVTTSPTVRYLVGGLIQIVLDIVITIAVMFPIVVFMLLSGLAKFTFTVIGSPILRILRFLRFIAMLVIRTMLFIAFITMFIVCAQVFGEWWVSLFKPPPPPIHARIATQILGYVVEHPIKTTLHILGVVATTSPAVVFAPLLGLAGFTSVGIAGGSIAAGVQSAMGVVGAGGIFATLQSAAMGGYGVAAVSGVISGAAMAAEGINIAAGVAANTLKWFV